MTSPETLPSLAAKVEAAEWPQPTRELNREVALAVGWCRKSPSEARRKHPAWFHPSDCRDGRVVLDSLHGTDVWREPLNYLGSIDAALTLVPEGWNRAYRWSKDNEAHAAIYDPADFEAFEALGKTEALALCAAALKARAAEGSAPNE